VEVPETGHVFQMDGSAAHLREQSLAVNTNAAVMAACARVVFVVGHIHAGPIISAALVQMVRNIAAILIADQ
jgi:hypothetical protein